MESYYNNITFASIYQKKKKKTFASFSYFLITFHLNLPHVVAQLVPLDASLKTNTTCHKITRPHHKLHTQITEVLPNCPSPKTQWICIFKKKNFTRVKLCMRDWPTRGITTTPNPIAIDNVLVWETCPPLGGWGNVIFWHSTRLDST